MKSQAERVRLTMASLFGGGGGWEVGGLMAGVRPLWSVEWEPRLGAMQHQFLSVKAPGHQTIIDDVRAVNPHALESPTILVASPVCKAHSNATSRQLCDREDAWTGVATLNYVRALLPTFVAIENAPNYAKHPAFLEIVEGLEELGYHGHTTAINAHDYGVPQSRRRMISRWSRLQSPLAPMIKSPGASWLEVVEDLIPTFPEDELAPWQVARIRRMLKRGITGPWPWLVSSFNVSSTRFAEGKVVLVGRFADQPAWTVVATPKAQTGLRILYEDGYTLAVTPRGLARMQGFPDDYKLGDPSTAIEVIGNAVPPPLAASVFDSFRRSLR